MILRKANERGVLDLGWIKSYHSFSFGSYLDPKWMGFKSLRVLNHNFLLPQRGATPRSQSNIEIVTLVLSGQLEHKNSAGGKNTVNAITAHSINCGDSLSIGEFNSGKETCEYLQLWFEPQKPQPDCEKSNVLAQDSLQDLTPIELSPASRARIYYGNIEGKLVWNTPAWIQIISGKFMIQNTEIVAGDGVGIDHGEATEIEGSGLICLVEFI